MDHTRCKNAKLIKVESEILNTGQKRQQAEHGCNLPPKAQTLHPYPIVLRFIRAPRAVLDLRGCKRLVQPTSAKLWQKPPKQRNFHSSCSQIIFLKRVQETSIYDENKIGLLNTDPRMPVPICMTTCHQLSLPNSVRKHHWKSMCGKHVR